MGTVYGANYTKALAGSPADRLGAEYGGTVHCHHETYTFASAGVGTILVVGVLKPGEVFLMGYIHGADLGSATTLEMGITGDTNKFLAATVFTTTDQKTLCLDDDGLGYKNDTAADVPIIITTGVEEASGAIEVLILKAGR